MPSKRDNEIASIYKLVDPKNNSVRYVGVTKRTLEFRLNQHIKEAEKKKSHKNNWIKSLAIDGLQPRIELIEVAPRIKEVHWIAWYKQSGCDLTNLTNGGDGNGGNLKKICKNGHLFIEGNFRIGTRGERVCILCVRERTNLHYRKKRQVLAACGLSVRGKPKIKSHCVSGKHLLTLNDRNNHRCELCKKEKYEEFVIRTNRRKPPRTHCKYGHEFTSETRYKPPFGRDRCKICMAKQHEKATVSEKKNKA